MLGIVVLATVRATIRQTETNVTSGSAIVHVQADGELGVYGEEVPAIS